MSVAENYPRTTIVRTMLCSGLAGFALPAAIFLVLGPLYGVKHGIAEGALLTVGGMLVFGFYGGLVGLGIGSLLSAPKWGARGAVLACLPTACLAALYTIRHPEVVPPP